MFMDGFSFVSKDSQRNRIKCQRASGDVIEAQIALGPRLRDVAYQIRYEAYHGYGFVPDRPDKRFSDTYDTSPNCKTILVFKNGHAAATIRVAFYDPANPDQAYHRVQAMEIFGEEIKTILASFQRGQHVPRAVEIGKLARADNYSKDMEVIFALFRAAGYLIMHHDVDAVFNAVRAHHMPMYRRFGFQQLEAPRQYPNLTFKTGLMACFRPSYDTARNDLPFLRGISTADDVYAGLIGGERVPIFGRAGHAAATGEATDHLQTA